MIAVWESDICSKQASESECSKREEKNINRLLAMFCLFTFLATSY